MTVFQDCILKGALAPRHLIKGLTVDEDDHDVRLMDGEKEVAVWGIYVHIKDIMDAADEYLGVK